MPTVLVCASDAGTRARLAREVGAVRGVTRVVTVGSAGEALSRVVMERPTLTLLEAGGDPAEDEQVDGAAVLARLLDVQPSAAVVMIAPVGHTDPVAESVAAGALGYVHEDASREQLVRAVSQGLAHASVRPPSVPIPLTPRELAVLEGMSRGLSNPEIGAELFLAAETVKSHAKRLLHKLGALDRAHAVALAFRQGLLR
ncbi:MAG: LuxR C-terminal-related transcriptional regulator [Oryzihumus sp.]